jgi:hypothetical protein
MCFSAAASFTSGAVLAVIGIASIKQTRKTSHTLFAAIPLIFAIQQITEGFLWLALKERIDPGWQTSLTYIFLVIAQVIWPFWVPLSISLLEEKPGRKKLFYVLTGIGAAISLTIIFRLVFYLVYATIEDHHIVYHLHFPIVVHYLGASCYFIATVIPCFTSSVKRMRLLGFLILLSYIVALIFYAEYAISVWCFFSAIISSVVYFISREAGKSSEVLLK